MDKEMNLEQLFSMIENLISGVGVFEYDKKDFKPLYINDGFFRMLGYSKVEGMKYLLKFQQSIIIEDREIFNQGIKDILKDDGSIEFEFRTVTASGGLRWLQVRGNLYSRTKDKYILIGIILDSSERKEMEEELKLQAERLNILSESEGEQIFDYNAKTDVLTIKASFKRGFNKDVLYHDYIEKFDESPFYKEDVANYLNVLKGALLSPKRDSVQFRTTLFDKDYKWYEVNITSIADNEGYVTRMVGRLTNIHEKKLKELALEVKAEKDGLTGLYNKLATTQLIQEELSNESDATKLHALMIIDLDNFKGVNDNLGHAVGDEILIESAQKMMTTFKGSDIIGRIGGDEFVVFMKDIHTISNTDILATKICHEFDRYLPGPCGDIHTSSSIGIAIFPYHGLTYEELFEKADKALYTAKAKGKNGYRIFDAAATITYHTSKRNSPYRTDGKIVVSRKLEDLIMQILFEDKIKESSITSILELMTMHYNMQRAVAYVETIPEIENEFYQFSKMGYEIPISKEAYLPKKMRVAKLLFKHFKQLSIIHVTDETLPLDIRNLLLEEEIGSLIYFPMMERGIDKGALFFENHISADYQPKEEELQEMRCVFRLLNAYILQLGILESPQDSVTLIEMLDNYDSYVYVVDANTYKLSFFNKKVVLNTPNIHIGDLCYKAIKNRETPCEDCVLHGMMRDNSHSSFTANYYIDSLKIWTKNNLSWLECTENNSLCLMNCIDVSEYLLNK
ncbi:MAG TPA: diguanylate cyclase [Lachnospiraceae bacterium]|nr:diguanylate cyclase [Lachnospiraceae bacterium]